MDIIYNLAMVNSSARDRRTRRAMAVFVTALVVGLVIPMVEAQPRQVSGIEAVRLLSNRKQYAEAEKAAYVALWSDIDQPEALALLAQAVDSQNRPEEAAVWYTWTLRVATESDLAQGEVARYKTLADRRLAVLNKEWDKTKAAYEKSAPGKKFESAEKVDDGWMTQVTGGLMSLHGIYAWKLVGGRKDRPADWIMNVQGTLHRSGLKRMDSVDGRKGILFTCFNPDKQPTEKRPLVNRIAIGNVAGARYLRIGTKGYNFPYGLKVSVGERELLSQTVGEKQWSDLKIDLGDAPAKGGQVMLTLFRPEKQRAFEGAWFDYIDFFDD